MKEIHLNSYLLITLLINKILITIESNCILKKFSLYEIQRMKCKAVSSGYNICVETKGIYSFNSLLTNSLYYYDFSSIIKIEDTLLLGIVAIEELKVGDIKNNIILCFIKPSYLFVLSYKGEFLFFNQIDNEFIIDNYCSFILFNYMKSTKDYNYIILYIQGFHIKMHKYSINVDKKLNEFISDLEYGGASNAGASCELLLDNSLRNVIVCFMIIYSEGYKFSSISFLADESLEYLSSKDLILDQDFIDGIKLIRTSSYDKTKVLVCLVGEKESKLAIYNITDNSFSQFISSFEGCSYYFYSLYLYYFEESEEFVFSCIDNEFKYLKMIPITKDFSIKENNKLEKYEFEGCTNIDLFSIIFIKSLNIYSIVTINRCTDQNYPVKIYLLIKDDYYCNNTIQNIKQLNETLNEESNNNGQYPQILETVINLNKTIESSILEQTNYDMKSNEISESNQIVTYNSKTELPNIKETDKINNTPICEAKCSTCNENSNSKSLCIECNEEEKYFQIINSKMDNELLNDEYKECIKEEAKPKNYYFDEIEKVFKPCYYTCETCLTIGGSNDHKCITCTKNYIFNINKKNNCIVGCKYYFYITNYKEYKCTIDYQCPEEASILIPELSKCTNNCKDVENYNYQYNGQCLYKCPDDTQPNENYICEIKSAKECTYKSLDLFLDNEIQKSNIENLAKIYAKEFSYTNYHIINFISDEYSIILYKTSECITKLNLNIPKIDFKECYQKVKNYYSLQKDLVISIIDRYIYDEKSGVKNPDTTYAFFHPETGVNLNANEICKDDKIIIEENILLIIKSNQTLLFFSNQNVDIFNISNEFYTDICFHFESPKNKDVVIKDRIQSYYPNVTLCDSGCKNTGINLTSLSAICECSFKDLLDNNFLNDNKIMDNIIINELVDQVSLALKILNLEVMKCYKTIFNPKYMSKCTGFYIVLIILLFELICVITYFLFGKKKFIGFIFKVSEIYKDLNLFKIKKRIDLDLTQNNINFPPKKKGINLKESNAFNIKNINFQDQQIQRFEKRNQSSKLISLNKLVKRKSQRKRKTMKNVSICINMTKFNINNIASNNNSNSILLMNNNYINKNNDNGNFQNMYRLSRKKIKSKSAKFSESNKVRKAVKEKFEGNSNEIGFNIEDYLLTPLDDIDFEDAILEKKSNFIIYFFERIKKQHIFINTFFIDDNIQPRSIKILLFLTEIDLYLLVNAMLFNEDYISEIFHNEKQDKFFSFTPRSINRYIYTTFSGTIIKSLIKLCFIKEKKYIKLLKRSENSRQLSTEIYLFHQKLSKGYNYFIIIVICITLFSWYYISCFNNVYQYTKNEWIISSIIFITTTLIFNALSALLETIFRYLSVELENEQIYKFSLYLRMFE